MDTLEKKSVVVTGATGAVGRVVVASFAAKGATVWAMGRDEARLAAVARAAKGDVRIVAADPTDRAVVSRVLEQAKPDAIVLALGARPKLLPIEEHTWESFSEPWEADVKSAFHFGTLALGRPLAKGSSVIIVSSGAAIGGSPLSGGYAGSKRMQWFLGDYLKKRSDKLGLGIDFHVLVPKQLVEGTDTGDGAAAAYAASSGLTVEKFRARWKAPLTAAGVADAVLDLVTGSANRPLAFGVDSQGIAAID